MPVFFSIYIDEKLKSKDMSSSKKEKLKQLSERLKAWATKHSYSLELKTKRMKERDKKVVCKSFHGAGIVVPVDENEVGYREVPETPGKGSLFHYSLLAELHIVFQPYFCKECVTYFIDCHIYSVKDQHSCITNKQY